MNDDFSLLKIRVLDDFFDDESWFSEFLKEGTGFSVEGANYPNLIFPTPLEQVKKTIEILGKRIHPAFLGNPFKVSLRVSLAEHKDTPRAHVHDDDNCLNVIIYLDGRDGPEGGTVFYRHRELGYIASEENMPKAFKALLLRDTNDLSKWEELGRIDFRRNRAVVFSGRYFHAPPAEYFGESVKSGRVTLNFFFPDLNDIL